MKPVSENELRQAVCQALSSVQFTDQERQRVIRKLQGEEKMKKKLPLALVLAIVLMLLTLSGALALVISHGYFESIGQMQMESGYYDEWTLDEKLKMLKLMEQYGVTLDPNVAQTARNTALPQEQREHALDVFMADQYGSFGRTDVISIWSIIEKEKGNPELFSVEEKAWYTAFQEKLGLLAQDEERRFYAPGPDELSQTQAEALARKYLKTLPEWRDAADTAQAVTHTLVRYCDADCNTWEILFYQPDTDSDVTVAFPSSKKTTLTQAYVAELYLFEDRPWSVVPSEREKTLPAQQRYQALIDKYGPSARWSLEVQHDYMPGVYLLPQAGDMSPADARERGREIVLTQFPDAQLDGLYAQLSLTEGVNSTRQYGVSFLNEKDTIIYGAFFRADNGEALSCREYGN